MLIRSLKWFLLWWMILQIIFEVVKSQVKSLQPQERISHTATYINNKLYILGGESITTNPTTNEIALKEFFYLDCSKSFDTTNLSWEFLSNIQVPTRWSAASAKGGINNDTIFIYGGFSNDENDLNLVYTYNTKSDTWIIPKILNNFNITSKKNLEAIINYNDGKIYLFGGTSYELGISNDMVILDTINLVYNIGNLTNAPTPRFYYGATLLPNQNIIYFGGNDGKEALDLDVVYLYDTINNIWNTNKVTGLIPSKRYLFSTVLGSDGRGIIIFGGFNVVNTDSLYILDTINLEWYVPNITGQLPANRYNHKANVIGNFMVVSFGYGYQQEKESDILLLNMTNEKYEWTIVFKPLNDTLPLPSTSISPPPTMTQTSSPTISSEPQSNISSTTIKPIIIAGVLVGILFIILGYLFL
ncbi:galactose oxidase [Rhizophagus irregularis]|uniref:Galactose oxidase n=1 Tax=Rhizophagus irregularis TaxID=588596 RepID=A0A2N0RIK2_9GLOM|nr:galactose oxidase [Rhizophagus irregularis]PKC63108.1 galactose oxidase [Rhizophagus irregularis]